MVHCEGADWYRRKYKNPLSGTDKFANVGMTTLRFLEV